MASKTANVILSVVGIVFLGLVALAVLFGPGLYRKGKEMVGPIMELAAAEKEIAELEQEMPWKAPADGEVDADRLDVFLDVRRELQPAYRKWDAMVRRAQRHGDESWQTAREVMEATREVFTLQTDTLRRHAMSPQEFRWLEEKIYDIWLAGLESTGPSDMPVEAATYLRSTTEDDLRFVEQLAERSAPSPALRQVEERLRSRLESLQRPSGGQVEGIPEETQSLLWQHHNEIASLDLGGHDIHSRLLTPGGGHVNVRLGNGQGRTVEIESDERTPEAEGDGADR